MKLKKSQTVDHEPSGRKEKELAEREANKKNDLKKSWNRDDR